MEDSHQASPSHESSVTSEDQCQESKEPSSDTLAGVDGDQVIEVSDQPARGAIDQFGEAEVINTEDASTNDLSKSPPETKNGESEMVAKIKDLHNQSNCFDSASSGDHAVVNEERVTENVQSEIENSEVVNEIPCTINDSTQISCEYSESVDIDSDSGLTFPESPFKSADCEVTNAEELFYTAASLDDCNKNCTSRAEVVVTPDIDSRGISPEIFCVRHMSPTELYGKDHLIGAPMVVTRPPSRQSTLNTPDPVYAEEEDSDEAYLCHNRGVKRGIVEVLDSENPVPCGFTDNFYQPNASNFLRPDATSMPKSMFVQQPLSTNQNYMTRQQSFCSEKKSQAAYRLDFSSPVNMCSSVATNPVSFNSFCNLNQHYPRSFIPTYLSSQSFLPANITRPMPIVPLIPSYPPYGFSQLDVNCNPCPPVPVLPYSPHTAFYTPGQAHTSASTNHLATYTSISPASGSTAAYPSNATQTRLNRTDQRTQNLNYTEFYTSTHQTTLSNTNQTVTSSAPRIQSYRLGSFQKRNPVIEDQMNNNLTVRQCKETVMGKESSKNGGENSGRMALDLRCRLTDKEIITDDGSKGDKGKPAISAQDKSSMVGEESKMTNAEIDAYNEGMINWRNRNATVPVALKTRDKKFYVSVSELGSKSVKQLLKSAGETPEKERDAASSPAKSGLVYNEAFIEKFKEERKTKSPMSAFCAALDEPRKPKTPVRITAEPRIPIPSLLLPNEVPMMFNGQTMVPYFQSQGLMPATSGSVTASVAHSTGEPVLALPAQYTGRTHLGLLDNFTVTSKATASAPSMARLVASQPLGRPIAPAPAVTQVRPAVPVYPAGCGQVPMVQPMMATPLYQQLPDPTPTAQTLHTPAVWPNTQQQARSHLSTTAEMGVGGSKEIQPVTGNRAQEVGGVSSVAAPAVPGSMKKPASLPRCWKAKHYGFTKLTIGTYTYTCEPNSLDRAARMKLMFRKRRLVYEYQVNASDCSWASKRIMTEIVVPFHTIVGLSLDQKELRVEVFEAPLMYGGVRGPERNMSGGHQSTIYNRKKTVDYTQGQLSTSPYHRFKTPCSAKLREDFEQFEDRFRDMLQQEFVEDANKSLKDKPLVKSYLPDTEIQPASRTPAVDLINNNTWAGADLRSSGARRLGSVCDCVEGCSSASSCACCQLGVCCRQGGCTCLTCQNPLNVLQNFGVPTDRAVTDPCLMDNIYKITRLDDYVKTQLTMDCCQCSALLYNCIPGVVACPNPDCGASHKFSWCSAHLCDEMDSPRNHCEKCHRCTDYRNVHCQTCNVCYFGGEHGNFKCAACHSPEEVLDTSSSDSD